MQQNGDETMTWSGLDYPGKNKEERPNHDESINR